jgi:hypothetical protein
VLSWGNEMAAPTFRNSDIYQRLPIRDYLRTALPEGSQGMVVEDLDLVIRHYGNSYRLDGKGRLMLVEQKHPPAWIEYAQEKTFGLIHQLIRAGDPDKKRYLGYYVLQIAFNGEEPVFPVTVNRKHELDKAQMLDWFNGKLILPGLWEE